MVTLEQLARIAQIEFSDIVDSIELMGTKLRIILTMPIRLTQNDALGV